MLANTPQDRRGFGKRLFLQAFLASFSLYLLGMALTGWQVGTFLQVALQLNYGEFGFTKRGLIGTVLHPLVQHLGPAGIHHAAFAYGLTIGVLLCLCTAKLIADCESKLHRILFILSPATLLQLGYTFGFLDSTCTLILLTQILLIPAKTEGSQPGTWRRVGIISALGATAVLIHEGWFVSALPLLSLLILRRTGRPGMVIATLIPAALALGAVAGFGLYEAGDQQLASLLGRDSNPVAMELTWSLGKNIQATMEGIWMSGNFKGSLPGIAYVFGLVYLALRSAKSRMSFTLLLPLLAAALSPLMLSVLGIDLPRWCGMAGFNILLLGLLGELSLRGAAGSPPARTAVLAVLAGPVGITGYTFPLTLGALGRIL